MSTAPGIGAEFAGYRVERLLGRGGVGLVYLAQDLRLPRHVALKILSDDVAGDERFRERFVRESRMAASIDHHNIVPIYQAGEVDGVLYIAMRYVAGTDLRTLLATEGTLDAERTLSIIGQVASALDVAHLQGLVHRDVKPGNILIAPRAGHDATDHAYLADFGITKRMSTDVTLTVAGQFVGTADYVAPEQIMGGVVDGRADIYSLACVLYQCLCGAPPFDRDSDVAVMYAHLSDPRPLLSVKRPELPGAIDEVIAAAMAKNPDDRHPTALAFVAAARAALLGVPQREPDTVPRGITLDASETPTAAVERPASAPGADATQAWSTTPAAAAADPATRTEVMLAPPPPLTPAAPWSGAASALPSRPGTLPARGMLIAVAIVLVAAGGALALVLSHRGGSPAATPPATTAAGVPAMLLTADDFPAGSVLSLTQQLRLADVRCGAAPAAETEEKQVAFQGQSGASGLDYFDATASFATNADARAYMDRVDAAQRACTTRLSPDRAAPQLGDRAVRVLFPSNDNTFTYDAVYINKGRYVSLILVAAGGTAPPPAAEAEKYAPVALRHMTDSGA